MLKKEKGRLSLQKWELFLLTAMVLAAVFSSFTAFSLRCREIRESTLRLHILANSDSEFDQQVKLSVRDGILNDTAALFSRCATRSQLERQAERELPRIEASARGTLRRLGVEEPVKAELATMFFDTRVYNDVVMPAGRYRAVRVTLGEGKGKNWWCVLFPPLCVGAATEEIAVTQPVEPPPGLGESSWRLVSQSGEYEIRFKLLEWLMGK